MSFNDDVADAAIDHNRSKNNSFAGLSSDHFINGGDDSFVHFYRAIRMHKRGICRHPVSVCLSVRPSRS